MKVQDLMTDEVKSCRPETNLAVVASLMWSNDCGALPVVADGEKVIGMITDRDIAIALGTKNRPASEIRVGEAMTGNLYACSPGDDIHAALKLMRKDKVRRLPVINEGGVLQGVLSLNDVALHSEKVDAHGTASLSYEDVVNTLKAVSEHRHPKRAKWLHQVAAT